MISVVIATYGDAAWERQGDRAEESVAHQPPVEVIRVHATGGTLAEARNAGAALANGRWIVFLDGDDTLAPGYLSAMCAAIDRHGPGHLLTPQVEYVNTRGRSLGPPRFHQEVDPRDGNWLVIGTAVHRPEFLAVGGFQEWPIYEDWALFAAMQRDGATPVKVTGAVYRATRRARSRNHSLDRAGKLKAHEDIRRAVWGV